jgi:hypothetical protein
MEIVRTFSPAYNGEPNIPKIKIIKQVNPITLIRFFITLLPNRLNIQKPPFLNTVKNDGKNSRITHIDAGKQKTPPLS